MNKKYLFLFTALAFATPSFAGLPEALLSLKYEQYSSALNEFQGLAAQGNPPSFYYLGRMYQNGWGVPENIPQALKYFQTAHQYGYLPAAAQIGKILLYGANNVGIQADPKRAVEYLKKAALAGSSEAAFELGNTMAKGLAGDVNFNHAFGFYSIAALKGHHKAQFELGKMYLDGRGVPQDYKKAITWMTRAANQGFVLAQTKLAAEYENNPKLKNLSRAYGWNSILAAYNSDEIGALAANKRDELANKIQADKLAEQQEAIRSWKPKTPERSVPLEERQQPSPIIPEFNDPKTLQRMLLQDGSLPQDSSLYGISIETIDVAEATGDRTALTEAVEKAIKQDRIKAAAFYGDILRDRFHEASTALTWYKTGAKAGDTYAQYQLAKAYCEGTGEAPNSSLCYAWLLIANETPDPVLSTPIQQALLAVRSNASTQELEKGQSLVEELKAEDKGNGLLDFF